MSSVTTAVHPDKESVYFQGSLTQMQAKQYANINRDNVTFLEIIKNEPRKQSYTDTTEFDSIITKFPFLSNKFIYKKVIDDARVIPDNLVMKNRMDEYFSPRFYKNILRMYQNAPLYFDHLFSREGITDQRHKQYSVYIYTLCMIEYIMKHYDSADFKLIDNYQLYYDWALPKYSEHISYIIKGPLSKSSSIKIDFKKHYATIMNPSNIEGDMTPVLQLASLQNLDTRLTQLFTYLTRMTNAYDKLKDEARTYNLIIQSHNVKSYNDPTLNNTFVIDLRNCDFGETNEALNRTANLNTIVTTSIDLSSRLSIHKLQELFTKYSRFRITSMHVNRELYDIPLDAIRSIDVVFHGIDVLSRSVTVAGNRDFMSSTGNVSYLNVPGRFVRDIQTRDYSFVPSIDVITYAPEKVRVTDARIYLTMNGSVIPSMFIGFDIDMTNLYNVEITNNQNSSTSTLDAGFIKTYRYGLSDTITTDDTGILKLNNALAYISSNGNRNVSAFKSGSALLFESTPFVGYTRGNTNLTFDLSTWDGTSDSLNTILSAQQLSTNPINTSVFIPCNANNTYGYTTDHGIWGMNDFVWSIFAIDTAGKYNFGDVGSSLITVTTTVNYLFMVNIDGVARTYTINQSNLPSNVNPSAAFDLTASTSVVSGLVDIYVSFALTDNQNNYTIRIFDRIPADSIIRLFYMQSVNEPRYFEASFTPSGDSLDDTTTTYITTWRYGLCFLPPVSELNRLFRLTESWTNLELTIDTRNFRSLYTITQYLPALNTFGASLNVPSIFTTDKTITGNQQVFILNSNNEIVASSVVSNWRSLVLLPTLSMKIFDYTEHLRVNADMTDVFNIQVELS